MKTSRKIMIVAGVCVLTLVVTSMVVFRRDVGAQIRERLAKEGYQERYNQAFHALDISEGWEVEVRQSADWKVEVIEHEKDGNVAVFVNDYGVLHCNKRRDYTSGIKVRARVTAPSLRQISADSGSVVNINGFKGDTIVFKMGPGSGLNWKESQFSTVILQSADQVDLSLTSSSD